MFQLQTASTASTNKTYTCVHQCVICFQECMTPCGYSWAAKGHDSDQKILRFAPAGSTCVDYSQIGISILYDQKLWFLFDYHISSPVELITANIWANISTCSMFNIFIDKWTSSELAKKQTTKDQVQDFWDRVVFLWRYGSWNVWLHRRTISCEQTRRLIRISDLLILDILLF